MSRVSFALVTAAAVTMFATSAAASCCGSCCGNSYAAGYALVPQPPKLVTVAVPQPPLVVQVPVVQQYVVNQGPVYSGPMLSDFNPPVYHAPQPVGAYPYVTGYRYDAYHGHRHARRAYHRHHPYKGYPPIRRAY